MSLTYTLSPKLTTKVRQIIQRTPFDHIHPNRVTCVESKGSKSRAYARIYAFPRVWQEALGLKPHYVIEVLSEKFNKLSQTQKDRVLIHELLHIPKTFSGALTPHKCFGKRIDAKTVEKFYRQYKNRN
ncbi:MAG: metallopeptidase [Candidatus Cloacimonetes bacterium]|nr:metallopeptidase [Candidatus Cloacimonadota bacterium]